MKTLLALLTVATLFAAPFSSTAFARGPYHQQQESGYPGGN